MLFRHYIICNMEYGIEARKEGKEYAVATVLGPRFKTAVFESRENANLAKLMALSEVHLAVSISSTVQEVQIIKMTKAAPVLFG